MGFDLELNVSVLAALTQGFLSFFSPCVVPLVPLYLGYLTGSGGNDQTKRASRWVTLRNTLFFMLGIATAFFALALGMSGLGQLLQDYRMPLARVGGILIILMGLLQLGIFNTPFWQKERRFHLSVEKLSANPITAWLLGFTFSFAWTPCVGPALTSVLLMAGSASTWQKGFLLIGVYTLGFTLPFLLVGLFTDTALALLKKHRKWLTVATKLGGVLLIFMGVMMFTGWMNGVTSYLSSIGQTDVPNTSQTQPEPTPEPTPEPESESTSEETQEAIPAPDFTLVDQYGNTHRLSDYKGKVVFLNFWASWCGPCRQEMPEIEALYQDWDENNGELVVLGVAAPDREGFFINQKEKSADEIASWLSQQGYTYPTVMDTTGEVFDSYGISAYPTTFMIDKEGNVFGYLSGAMTRSIMDSIVEQTFSGVRR